MKKENVDLLLNVAGDLDTDKADEPDVFLCLRQQGLPSFCACLQAQAGFRKERNHK